MRAIKIDCATKEIKYCEVSDLESMQAQVGGLLALAHEFPNGDTIYVNDEGLLNAPESFFYPQGALQPFAGNGLVVGPADASGETLEVQSTPDDIIAVVSFLTPFQAIELARTLERFGEMA